jgi:hypothetical protein
MILGSDNDLLKAFHGEKTGFSEPKLRKYLEHSLENYEKIVNLRLSVAEILNKETALASCFVIQKRIPHELDIRNPQQMAQVQRFFTASKQNNVPMDLQPQNLRVDDNGLVHLIDFLEEDEELEITTEVQYRINCSLIAFRRQCTSSEEGVKMRAYLIAGI